MNTTLEAEKKVKSGASIFEAMTDQRKLKAIRYQFQPLLILLSLSKLCLPDRPSEIAHWVTNPSAWLKEKLRLQWKPMPSLSTWQSMFANHLVFSQGSIDGSEQGAVATRVKFDPLTTVRGSDLSRQLN